MAYLCTHCAMEHAKWQGKCSACQAWNTLTQTSPVSTYKAESKNNQSNHFPKKLEEVIAMPCRRIATEDVELNRVLGGGIVPGSLVLLGGEPGIGKSTLMLQMALQLHQVKTLYVSGEETESQISMRAARIGLTSSNFYLVQERSCTQVLKHAGILEVDLIIIDSIQTLCCQTAEGSMGSMHQIRASTIELLHYTKSSGTTIFLIGHINKEGNLAGPKLLEHMVDTVLYFEADVSFCYRMVRTVKNRFGTASELGIYEMTSSGLQGVQNPSAMLLSTHSDAISGLSIGSFLEGTRPFMIEVQSLVTESRYGHPQRNATGYDLKRLTMLLAVLEKRGNLRLNDKDIFLNITGGLKVADPALDLAVCMAIASALKDHPIAPATCFIGEITLSGTLIPVQRIEQRIREAKKLGFKEIFLALQKPALEDLGIKINPMKNLKEVIKQLGL